MKLYKIITVFSLLFLTLISCKNETAADNSGEEQITAKDSIQDSSAVNDSEGADFNKVLESNNIKFTISTQKKGDLLELTVQPSGLEIVNDAITQTINGKILNAEIEDLNGDGFPEVLIYTLDAENKGNVIGYSVNNGKSVSEIYFSNIAEDKTNSVGYNGGDEFSIVENTLSRRFPVFVDGNVSSKMRQIDYKLVDGEASRMFKIKNVSEFDKK